jgi:hypothetical protein
MRAGDVVLDRIPEPGSNLPLGFAPGLEPAKTFSEMRALFWDASCFASPFCRASKSESKPEDAELLLDMEDLLACVSALVSRGSAGAKDFLGFLKREPACGTLSARRVDSKGLVRYRS